MKKICYFFRYFYFQLLTLYFSYQLLTRPKYFLGLFMNAAASLGNGVQFPPAFPLQPFLSALQLNIQVSTETSMSFIMFHSDYIFAIARKVSPGNETSLSVASQLWHFY